MGAEACSPQVFIILDDSTPRLHEPFETRIATLLTVRETSMADVVYRYEIDGVLVDLNGNKVSLDGSFQVDYTTGTISTDMASNVNIPGFNIGSLSSSTAKDGTTEYTASFKFFPQGPYLINYGSITFDTMYPGYADSASVTEGITQNPYGLAAGSDTYSAQKVPLVASAVTVCFAAGTRIRTARGEITVENLRIGDRAMTASGAYRPITWIGHRNVACSKLAAPHESWPVRVRAGAFGGDLPERDLFLSPGHPVLVGDHLVPIMCLINGTSVARSPCDQVTYWHVELDRHDILLAEGLPAESFLDYGNRGWFGGGAVLLDPDYVAPGLAGRCRPVTVDGPVVGAERRRLDTVFAMGLVTSCDWPTAESAYLS